MLSLEKTEIEDAATAKDMTAYGIAAQYRLDAQREIISRLEASRATSNTALEVLTDKHNRFSGMMMAAMADEIKVLISGEVSEQLSKAAPDWNIEEHRTEIMDVVRDDFDIDDHQYDVENIIDNHFTFDNYSDSINDMIRDYINDCTVTIETP